MSAYSAGHSATFARSWRSNPWSARRWYSSADASKRKISKRARCIRRNTAGASATPMHADPDQPAITPPDTGICAAQALAALRGSYPEFAPGEVWLVGAGPGDPGLLTLDALAGLIQADVGIHEALVDARALALARRGARLPLAGKRGGKPSIAQEDISALLVDLARRGERVLRLKGGDPFVFGRGGEEILALAAAGVPFRIVPGVTAGLAALASAWIPATLRGVNQAIILATGHDPDDQGGLDWSALARTRGGSCRAARRRPSSPRQPCRSSASWCPASSASPPSRRLPIWPRPPWS